MRGHGSTRRRARPRPIAAPTAPLRQVATRGDVPYLLSGPITNAAQLRRIYRTRHHLGGQGATELRLGFGNYAAVDSGTSTAGEVTPGNPCEVQAAVEFPVGAGWATRRVTFAGAPAFGMADGEALVVSDPLRPADFGLEAFPAGAQFWVRHARTVPSGGRIPRAETGNSPSIPGERAVTCDVGTDPQLDAVGALVATGAYAGGSEILKPLAILGRTAAPQMSVAGIGDSITYNFKDGNGDGVNGAGGWFQRGLANVGGHRVPFIRLAAPGERATGFLPGGRRRQLLRYCTHATCNYGTNDISQTSMTPQQILAQLRLIWAACKAEGVARVEQVLILPRVSATADAYATVAGQTPQAGYEAGGAERDPLNAALVAEPGTNGLDAVIDFNPIAADAGAPDRWVANGTANHATTDGTHPGPALHGLMASAFAARVATWSA